jgi:endonuclease I
MYDFLTLVEFEGNEEAGYYEMGDLSTLIEWHENDPVDDFEMNRNNVIESIQGNRNPFIDHPEFVNKIWGVETTLLSVDITTTTLSAMI